MPSPAPRASRRAVLAGSTAAGAALLVATTSGCGVSTTDQAGASVADTTAPAVDADSDLVETVARQLESALTLAAATGRSLPALKPFARPLVSLHRSHLGELGRTDAAGGGKVTGTAETARARLLRSEQKLQRQLVDAALVAESGALAQVFASMAAAIAQQLAVSS